MHLQHVSLYANCRVTAAKDVYDFLNALDFCMTTTQDEQC